MQKNIQWILTTLIAILTAVIGYQNTQLNNLSNDVRKLEVTVAAFPKEIPPPMFAKRVDILEAQTASFQTSIGMIREDLVGLKAEIRYLAKTISDNERTPYE